ncbi:MAG TPA: PD-(D/E)XK nuclease family protein [Thermomicrobiales bacterium]|nr:PD-(D/E)XK nuclease family protein [Thermomicrobiales bacterium]
MSGAPPAPRWPHDRWISPTALKAYAQCPKRVRLQHLDGVEAPWHFSLNLAKGRITHLALKRIADALAAGRVPIDNTEVAMMGRRQLPIQEFPSRAAYDASLADIERWVAYGRRYLEHIPDPVWLVIEKNQRRKLTVLSDQTPYALTARPDVAVLRHDASGPLVEIIDYKTGVIRPEPDPPVIMRFVTRKLLQELGDPSAMRIRFTYLWLDHADRTEIDLSVEHCTDAWPAITRQVQSLVSETDWRATPSWWCRWCPYHQNVCTETIPPDESAV